MCHRDMGKSEEKRVGVCRGSAELEYKQCTMDNSTIQSVVQGCLTRY